MSSSNRVRVAYIKETDYGVTPNSGNFSTARFTSEKLSGTPTTTQSAQIRTDRMSSGQVVTGLTVGGEIDIELAKDLAIEDFMANAMYNAWDVKSLVTVDLTIDITDPDHITLTRATGTWDLVVGDFVKLGGFADAENNTYIMVSDLTSATVIEIIGKGLVSGTGTTTTYKRGDKLSIGITQSSFSMEKAFLDLTTKAINYRGMIASDMAIDIAYGSLITGSFTFSGNDQEFADQASEFMTNGRTINAPATTDTLNGSIDMPFLATSAAGILSSAGLCIQSASIKLSNNLTDLTCIGKAAPEGYSAGTAAIEVDLSTYLKDTSWALLPKKLTQEPFEVGFIVLDASGGYGFYMPAVQASFDDPASGGADQQVSLDLKGTAKVGPNGESSLNITRF